MIYLASPYSHPDLAVRNRRFSQAVHTTLELQADGVNVFSPIVYGHAIATWQEEREYLLEEIDTTAAGWQAFNFEMFNLCNSMKVIGLVGWVESIGVTMELEWAASRGFNVEVLREGVI